METIEEDDLKFTGANRNKHFTLDLSGVKHGLRKVAGTVALFISFRLKLKKTLDELEKRAV